MNDDMRVEELQRTMQEWPCGDEPRGIKLVELNCDTGGAVPANQILARVREAFAMLFSMELGLAAAEVSGDALGDVRTRALTTLGAKPDEARQFAGGFSVDRDWYWWDSCERGEDCFTIRIDVHGFPISGRDALVWLIRLHGTDVRFAGV